MWIYNDLMYLHILLTSVVDPQRIDFGRLDPDPDPDPGWKKCPTKIEKS